MAAGLTWFGDVELAPPIEVFQLTAQYNEDPHPNKVNLGVGAYRTDEGKPWVLPVVQTVESQMAADVTLNHEYLAVPGLAEYRTAGYTLLLGENSLAVSQQRVDAVQAIGGTGALRIGLDFLRSRLGMDTVYSSKPTWANHKGISKSLGYPNIREYRYWKESDRSLDIAGMIEDLQNAPAKSVILLHMTAHNPTGVDPTEDQWHQIAAVCKEKKLFVFLDCAYQGFSSGDLEKDAWPARYFDKQGTSFFAAQSFSKNFGLYNERVGNLVFVTDKAEEVVKVRSQLATIVRQTYSNPPAHGGRVVATVLNNPALRTEWKQSVKTMADRILLMRKMLYDKLRQLGTPGTWEHVVRQTGMFSYTGLSPRQVEHLNKQYHIYMLKVGRINMCGLNTHNMDYVANAIHETVINIHD